MPSARLSSPFTSLCAAIIYALLVPTGASAQTGAVWLDLPALTVIAHPLPEPAGPCTDTFITHELPHITSTDDGLIQMFEANGAGLAIGDLDNDGNLDIVLGSLVGPNSILWNEGDLQVRKTELGQGNTRAITLVDVDGDMSLDIVLARTTGAINFWHNQGDGSFVQEVLPGISRPASVLNWADMDGDSDLDLVTASYDAGLLTDLGNTYLLDGSGGITYYENNTSRFAPQALAEGAQAMAILLHDLNEDGRPDITVGNDFAVPDRTWFRNDTGWSPATPFSTTSHSTMSLDLGDINNDGSPEIFSSDMKPYAHDPVTMAAWEPLMGDMQGEHDVNDPQHMENMLQVRRHPASFVNRSAGWGIDGTGWSWSAKFGDLDNDGYLDLYVVNGMIEERMFSHLPNHELVEENQAFRNSGEERLVRMPGWALNSTYSGRGMGMADLDQDGDLDIVVNNLRGPAQLFENQLCGGDTLQVDLRWPQSANTHGLGAQLTLYTTEGIHTRDVRAASGYLSGDAARIHFGFPVGAGLLRLDVLWPDGQTTVVDELARNQLLTIERR